MAVEHVIKEGNQRRAFAASGHVGRTKIRDYRYAQLRCDDGGFTRLPSAGNATAEEWLGIALVIERLTVAPDQFALQARAALRGAHGISIEFAQQKIQAAKIGDTGRLRVHRSQHSAPHIVGVRELIIRQQLKS